MEGSGDRRVRRTKARLREALTGLLAEKELKEITVTELTERADVNRGTFYCHYRDVYDMAEQLERETFAEFTALMDAYTANELRKGLRPILEDVFRFLERNLDLTGLILRTGQRTAFLERLKEIIREKVGREWSGLYRFKNAAAWEYCLDFVVGGVVSLMQTWVQGECRETAEEMAALTENMIQNGIAPLETGGN